MTWLDDNHFHSSDRLARGIKARAKLKPLPSASTFAISEIVTYNKIRTDTDVSEQSIWKPLIYKRYP